MPIKGLGGINEKFTDRLYARPKTMENVGSTPAAGSSIKTPIRGGVGSTSKDPVMGKNKQTWDGK